MGTSSNSCSSPPGGSTIYTFEANGNETGAGSTTYSYDLENRMVSAVVGGITTAYAYDGDSNRLSASTSGTTTDYLWDVNELLPLLALERSGGSTLRDYSYPVGLNSMTAGGSNYFYLLDAYSGVGNVTSSSGATEWTYATDPFGTSTSTKNDPNAPTTLMRYSGEFLDPVTGLYNLRARAYDPASGRFLQIDPLHSSRAAPYTASYAYAVDAPTVFSDPSGMDVCLGYFCASDALKGAANFVAGGANLVTTTVTAGHVHVNPFFCGPGLGISYLSGEVTTGVEFALATGGESVTEEGAAAELGTEAESGLADLSMDSAQLESKFKHAADFGVAEPRGAAGYEAFGKTIDSFVNDSGTIRTLGTYRGAPAILNYNPATAQVVVQSTDGAFISAWRMSAAQLQHVIESGSLGGG